MLSIAKSSRVAHDKYLINHSLLNSSGHAQILGIAEEKTNNIKAQIDYEVFQNTDIAKTFRINGVIVSTQEFVGNINSVFFDTDDIQIITGPPSGRRKYLNILLSQINNNHVKNLQRFQKVLMQRNKLIKNIKDGKSNKIELEFWDSRLSEEGSSIFFERNSILKKLMKNSKQLANELNKSIEMEIYYTPRIGSNESSEIFNENPTVQDIKDLYTKAIEKNYQRDIDQRTTLLGPHRDDFIINFNETIASSAASRGQARIMSLALKLSEAEEIINLTNKKPILILDDIFSELDQNIRNNIIKKLKKFEQVLISTADMNLIDKKSISESNVYSIKNGKVSKE